MNKHLHRIVFNAARGIRMAVQETARSAGKAASGSTEGSKQKVAVAPASRAQAATKLIAPIATAIALMGGATLAQAQIVASPNAPAGQRPTVLMAPNGVPLVNIQTPSAAGVSRNTYNAFNVAPNGVILNNSRTDTSTQLGGAVGGNPWLAGGPARIILNEVDSGNPSQLRGFVEVAGQRAEVIIANPAGISVDGGGFINASRATLTTGTAQFNAVGGLDSFLVRGGTITIDGKGLDASRTDYAAILSRALEVNAGIWASELKVVTGANQISADHSQITAATGSGAAPTFALDVAQLGGMYAGKIVLIGTEAGLGARNAGNIVAGVTGVASANGAPAHLAGAGQLVVTASGRLENTGTLQGSTGVAIQADSLANAGKVLSAAELNIRTRGDLANHIGDAGGLMQAPRLDLASAAGDIDNSHGTLRQTGDAALTLTAPGLSNTNGGVIGPVPLPATPAGSPADAGGTTAPADAPATSPTPAGSGTAATGAAAPDATPVYLPSSPGTVTAAGTLRNDAGRIESGGALALQTPQVDNSGGTISVATFAAAGASFRNVGGTFNVAQGFTASVADFDNSGGTLHAGSLQIASTGDLRNAGGTLQSDADAGISAGGAIDNTGGKLTAVGALTVHSDGSLTNAGGTLAANNAVQVASASIDNSAGKIQSATAGTRLTAAQAMQNTGGTVSAATDLQLQAGSLANGSGSLRADRDAAIDVAGSFGNAGSVTAGRDVTVTAGALQSSATSLLGAGIQNDGSVGTVGNLQVSTQSALAANGRNIAAGRLGFEGASIDVSGSQTGAAAIALTGKTGNVDTHGATVAASGASGDSGDSGALAIHAAGALLNQGGSLGASQVDLQATDLHNQGGEIVQTGSGAQRIAVTGVLDNSQGRMASNGQDLTLAAADMRNTGGTIQHAGTGTLAIDAGQYSGVGGSIDSNGALGIHAGAFDQSGGSTSARQIGIDATRLGNNGGQIVQTGTDATRISVTGAIDNTSGKITSNGVDLAIHAGSIANASGSVGHAGSGTLALTVAGALDNTQGQIVGNGALDLQAAGLVNDGGSISATQVAIANTDLSNHGGEIIQSGSGDTHIGASGTLDNTSGHIASNGANLSLTAGTLVNTAGQIEHAGSGTLAIDAGAISGADGSIVGNGALTVHAGAFDQHGGKLSAVQVAIDAASLNNQSGQIVQTGDSAGDVAHIAITGPLDNSGGTLAANAGNFDIGAGSLRNAQGHIQHAGAGTLTLATSSGLANTQGDILGNGAVAISGGAFGNQGGSLMASQLTVNVASIGNAGGSITQTGSGATLLNAASDFDNSGGQIASNGADMTVQAGDTLTNAGGAIGHAGTGTLTVSAATLDARNGDITGNGALAIRGGTFLNDNASASADALSVDVQSLSNTGGKLVQTGTADTSITVVRQIDNRGGLIASNGQNLSLQSAALDNSAGQIQHAGSGALTLNNSVLVNGQGGEITGNGALDLRGVALSNDGGSVQADQITVRAVSLSNRGGSIGQSGTGATTIVVTDTIDNSHGVIASNGATRLNAAQLVNQGGSLRAAGTANLNLSVSGALDNSRAGDIGAGGSAVISAGSLDNTTGSITAVGDLGIGSTGAVTNTQGTLAANGNTTLTAASLDNTQGLIGAVNGALGITTSQQTVNTSGKLQSGTSLTLASTGLGNAGGSISAGTDLALDTRGAALDNRNATVAATRTVTLSSGALDNTAGLIQSGGAMAIDTHGGALTNTQASAHAGGQGGQGGQGGIASGGSLALTTGALDNTAGYIGAVGDLNASTAQVTNSAGGLIVGQGRIGIDTHGANFGNAGGQVQSVGDLNLAAGAGAIDNTAGLIRSGATTALSAASIGNADTSGADQGIEGLNVAIATGTLTNTSGAVRADQNATVSASQRIDNTSGLISAGDTVHLTDPLAAANPDPAARGLVLLNTNGRIEADQKVQIEAASWSGDGAIVSGLDLSLSLAGDLTNNGELAANGNLSYSAGGNIVNNGRLHAGQTLAVTGANVTNNAGGEMSGTDTRIATTGTLTNRGLVDSSGLTRIDAGAVNNIGSGRIYGDHVAIGTGALSNVEETVNGTTRAATIAARQRLDIGAGSILNREHALVYSAGDMAIGGALDGQGNATGQGGTLNNLSATIEAGGNLSIAMGQINNLDTHIQLGPQITSSKTVTTVVPVGGTRFYTLDEVAVVPGSPVVYLRNPDGSLTPLSFNGYGIWNTTYTTTQDTAINADPAKIVAGGDMSLVGATYNRDSKVIAGGLLTAQNVTNEALKGSYQTTSVSIIYDDKGQLQPFVVGTPTSGTVDVGSFAYINNTAATSGSTIGAAAGGSGPGANAGVAGSIANSTTGGAIIEVPAAVNPGAALAGAGATSSTPNPLAPSDGSSSGSTPAGAGGTASTGAPTIPQVVRTTTPDTTLPTASLYGLNPGPGSALVTTDNAFTHGQTTVSSDALIALLGGPGGPAGPGGAAAGGSSDPAYSADLTLKRLGDGWYEQRLINEQVAKLTGYRYLDGFNNDADQYAALINAGATFAKRYQLVPGVALTAAQMAHLTSDIVWLVAENVTLPDGSTQRVLVPQVYVRVRPGDIDGSGSLLSADALTVKGAGDLNNTGTLAGRSLVSITAENVNNLVGGRIAGGSVSINAASDIRNIGASITAANAAVLTAGRDIEIASTTRGGGTGNANLDRIAGVYVSQSDGVLIASAGRDLNLTAGILNSAGTVSVGAGRNINLATVTEAGGTSATGAGIVGIASQSREMGSVIQGAGNVRLAAGNDLAIRAGAVASTGGALVATAGNDIRLTAGQATSSVATASASASSNLFHSQSASAFDSSRTTQVLSSSLSGNTVALVAGRDIDAQAAQLRSDVEMSLSAGRDVNLGTATQTDDEAHASQSRRSASALATATGFAFEPSTPWGASLLHGESHSSAEASITQQAIGTSLSAGSLQIVSGRDTTLTGATVVADGDISILAGRNLTIESAQNTSVQAGSHANAISGSIGKSYEPSLGNVKGFDASASVSTTQSASQVASLQGNVTLVAGDTYRQTASSILAAGQAGPLVGGDVNILAKNVVIGAAYDTEQSVSLGRSSSTILGGSASVGAFGASIGTNDLKGAISTVQAIGNTSDARMQALGAVNLAIAGKQAYDAGSNLAAAAGGATGAGGASPYSYGVSVSLSRNQSQSTSFTTSTQAVGSGIVGAHNVNIVATGAGAGSNIQVTGSTLAAGDTVNLAADNAITLEASQSASITAGRNTSSGASVGVTYGAGAQNGFSIQLGVSGGQGRDNQNEVTHTATQVSGAKAVNINAGGDLTLNGATVEAARITAEVGGNLAITSVQDVSVGQSHQSSSGANVSLCIPPICYGAVATGSASLAGAKADGVFLSPGIQSGLKAGDGGFNVNVRGNTSLTGAVIESTQAAIDHQLNSFQTGGTLTMVDLQNVSNANGSSYAVSGGVSVGQTTAPVAATDSAPAQPASSSWTTLNGRPSGSAGVGSSSSSQSATSLSGISGIAGAQGVRTGDSASAGTLVRDWNTQTIVQNVQAQAQLTQQFNQNAAREIGTYAGNQASQLRAQAKAETDPTRQQTLLNEASQWDEGGAYRVALHTAAGALAGGVGGALGAGASAALMPHLGQAIEELGLPAPVAQALGAVTAAAIGNIAGGTAGAASGYSVDINNRQLHPDERAWLRENRARIAQEARASNPAAFAGLDDQTVIKLVDQMASVNLDDQATQSLLARFKGTNFEPAMGAIRANLLNDAQNLVFVDNSGETLRMFTNTTVTRGGDINNPAYYYDSSKYSQYLPTTARGIAEFSNTYGYAPPLTSSQIASLDSDAKGALGTAVTAQNIHEQGGISGAISNIVQAVGQTGVAGFTNVAGGGAVPKGPGGSVDALVNLGENTTPLPPPRVTVSGTGVTEVVPAATPTARQIALNTVDTGGSGRLRPAEAAVASQIEPVLGTLKRYDGPPTSGTSLPDFVIANGPGAGKTVEMMYTTGASRPAEIAGLNRDFAQQMTVSNTQGEPPPGVVQIQRHFDKADKVVMDFRTLTPQNQQILTNYLNTLPSAQQSRLILIR